VSTSVRTIGPSSCYPPHPHCDPSCCLLHFACTTPAVALLQHVPPQCNRLFKLTHARTRARTVGVGGYLGYSKQKVATYEEFENIVLGAHLQPMEDDILDLDMKKTQKSSTGR
jgi:hypothetical protein